MIYDQEITTAKEIIENFAEYTYIMLLAQMQSGKTGTFLLVIFEMIRLGMVDFGVIFSGNRETDLKDQTEQNISKFYVSYAEYLTKIGIVDHSIIDIIKAGKKKGIKVVWGPDLKDFKPLGLGKIIYVWEESHYGQTKNQQIDKFITRIGIDPTGNLIPAGCFVLSVSATPFSEYVDFLKMEQTKCIVRLRPPETYLSVKDMLRNGQIHTYTDSPKSKFAECLDTYQDNGYAIVRGMAGDLAPIAIRSGWDVIYYNQQNPININVLLSTRPARPTVIFLKGMIRMGKQLKKNFVLFCFETSKTFKTDTILQGLLGRCCGYDSNESIHIYIRRIEGITKIPVMVLYNGKKVQKQITVKGKRVLCKCIKKVDKVVEDILRFISLHENADLDVKTSPFRGTNMTGIEQTLEQIPIKVEFDAEEWDELVENHNGTKKADKSVFDHLDADLLRAKLIDKASLGAIENKNDDTESEIVRILNLTQRPFVIHYKKKKNGSRNEGMRKVDPISKKKPMEAILHAYDNDTPLRLGFGKGVRLNELVIFPDNSKKCVYITFCMPSTLGNTTKREVFAKKSLSNIYTSNGRFSLRIPATIAVDADAFISVISECVAIYRGADQLIVPSFITPLKMGIILNNDIFEKIKPGQEIHNALLALGIILSYKRAPGNNPVGINGVRLSRISWKLTDDVEYLPVASLCSKPSTVRCGESIAHSSVVTQECVSSCISYDDVPMIMAVFTE